MGTKGALARSAVPSKVLRCLLDSPVAGVPCGGCASTIRRYISSAHSDPRCSFSGSNVWGALTSLDGGGEGPGDDGLAEDCSPRKGGCSTAEEHIGGGERW